MKPMDNPTSALKVGATVWWFNENRRVYSNKGGAPIYREHFEPVEIVGETSRSWIVAIDRWHPTKIDKKTLKGIYPSERAVTEACYLHETRYEISRAVESCNDYATLVAVEYLVKQWMRK